MSLPPASRSPWHRAAERPFVLGHRGARHAAPENTIAAFDLALDEGADGVELDVRLDGAGRVIVLHDRTLARIRKSDDHRDVETLDERELGSIRIADVAPVPTLGDVVAWARRRDARVNIELKHDVGRPYKLVRDVTALLRDERGDRFLLSSFHVGFVAVLRRACPTIPVGWLLHDRQRWLGSAPARSIVGATAIHPQTTMTTARRLAPWQREGRVVNVWTVNEPDDARRLNALGVDGIITDCPSKILGGL